MSEAAKIILTGKSTQQLKDEIKGIKQWDSGHNYPIRVSVDGKRFKDDSISNVENAIHNNLEDYINKNFITKGKLLKTGGNDDFYVVTDVDAEVGAIIAGGKKGLSTNVTPKKKKRKKNRKTHRR